MMSAYLNRMARQSSIRLWTETWPSSGPVCLLVGGAGAISTFWPDSFCEGLAGLGYEVIRYDHRDTGLSTIVDMTQAPYGLDDLVDDAMAILDEAGAERAHIIGHSMGGFIAQLASIQHPDRVMSFTSISSHSASPRVPPPAQRTWDVMLANHPVGELRHDMPGYMDVWRYLNGEVAFDEAAAEEYTRDLYTRNPATLPARNHVAIQQGMADRTAALKRTSVPGLVIHGECDPLVPLEGGLITADAIPVSRLAVLPGAGHMFFNRGVWSSILGELADHLSSGAVR